MIFIFLLEPFLETFRSGWQKVRQSRSKALRGGPISISGTLRLRPPRPSFDHTGSWKSFEESALPTKCREEQEMFAQGETLVEEDGPMTRVAQALLNTSDNFRG
jgi:hypothetical protein